MSVENEEKKDENEDLFKSLLPSDRSSVTNDNINVEELQKKTAKNSYEEYVDKERGKEEINNEEIFSGNKAYIGKKKKRKREYDFDYAKLQDIGKKKSKIVVQPEIIKLINELIKNKTTSTTEIIDKFREDESMTPEKAKFLSLVILLRNSNQVLSIPDILNNRSFELSIIIDSYEDSQSFVFTNDKLYWMSKIYPIIEKVNLQNLVSQENNKISLKTYAFKLKYDYKTGYIRDYKQNFSYIAPELFSTVQKAAIDADFAKAIEKSSGVKLTEFFYNGVKYNCYSFTENDARIIIAKDDNSQISSLTKTTLMFDTKKKLKSGLKVNKIPEEQIYISEDNLELTDFSPSVLIFGDRLKYSSLFSFKVNMLNLENLIYDTYLKNKNKTEIKFIGQLVDIPNLVSWDTTNLFIDFMYVEALTKYYNETDIKDMIITFNENFMNQKLNFKAIKKVLVPILKDFDIFYNSFKTKIDVNKLEKINDNITQYKDDFDKLSDSEAFTKIEKLIVNNGLTKTFATIYNCVKQNAFIIRDIMKSFYALFQDYRLHNKAEFINSAREIGKLIYELYMQRNDCGQLIDKIATPSSFLGDISFGGDEIARKAFENILDKNKKEEKIEEEAVDFIEKLNSIDDKKAFDFVLGNFFEAFNDTGGYYDADNEGLYKDSQLEKFLKLYNIENQDKNIYKRIVNVGKYKIANNEIFDINKLDRDVKEYLSDTIVKEYDKYLEKDRKEQKEATDEVQQQIDTMEEKLKKFKNFEFRPMPLKNISEKNMIDFGIDIYNKEPQIRKDETETEFEIRKKEYEINKDIIDEARVKGVTDDITMKNITKLQDLFTKDDTTEFKNYLSKLKDETQKLYGENGEIYKKMTKYKRLSKKIPSQSKRTKTITQDSKKKKERKTGAYKKFIASRRSSQAPSEIKSKTATNKTDNLKKINEEPRENEEEKKEEKEEKEEKKDEIKNMDIS